VASVAAVGLAAIIACQRGRTHQSNTNKEHTRQGFCKTNKNNREQTVGFLKMLFKLNLTAAPRV
jgi:hypothetical protein